ncbi:MAG: sporulation integral membrane protein YlbJ [Clostridia bacterium]|nr:sporulation integral membrane protein YlbJ [Clostridia bacterium]
MPGIRIICLAAKKNYLFKALACLLAGIFLLAMISQPRLVFNGALRGLDIWWTLVFPSLLPFFIISELLLVLGIVRFMGVLLEPLMRPWFNLPGGAALVFCLGFTSGAPLAAMLTARLRQEGEISRAEGERLLSFTNNASPLFILVAVAVGMLKEPQAGLSVGFLMRFYGGSSSLSLPPGKGGLWLRACRELAASWREEQRPLGRILGDIVQNSVKSLLYIGGFIIIFAVLIQLLSENGFIEFGAEILAWVLAPLQFSPEVLQALSAGFWEMTLGCQMAAGSETALTEKLMAISLILGWSGLSVQSQIAGFIGRTDLRFGVLVMSRMVQAVLAVVYLWLLGFFFQAA